MSKVELFRVLVGFVLMVIGALVAFVCLVSIREWPSIYTQGGFGEPPLTRGQMLSQCIGGILAGGLLVWAGWWLINHM